MNERMTVIFFSSSKLKPAAKVDAALHLVLNVTTSDVRAYLRQNPGIRARDIELLLSAVAKTVRQAAQPKHNYKEEN